MKQLLLVFITALTVSYGALCLIYDKYQARRQEFIVSEFDSIQTRIQERLTLYNRSTLALSKAAEQFWQQPEVTSQEFAAMGETILGINDEAIGANFVDPDGKITKVYPVSENSPALGRISQNIAMLKERLKLDNAISMSPPFELYQGGIGFVFYFPLLRGQKFLGWYGIVISQQKFLKHFLSQQQFQNFQVNLRDGQTKRSYLETAPLPTGSDLQLVRTNTFIEYGRQFILQTWPKDTSIFSSGWPLVSFVSLLFAFLVTLASRFFLLRRTSQHHLAELNALLRHVIHDTANSVSAIKGYVEMMKEDPRLVPMDRMALHVGFVVELLDQIKLIRALSNPAMTWQQQQEPLLPMLLETIEGISGRLSETQMIIDYHPDKLADLQTKVNQKLFVHAVLANALGTTLRKKKNGSTITVSAVAGQLKFEGPISRKLEKSDELSLAIAQKVMLLQGGLLTYQQNGTLQIPLELSH